MSSSQLFKTKIPTEFIIDLFNKITIKIDKHYIIDVNSFKKGMFNNNIPEFINQCIPYYHASKQKYLKKNTTYKSFITIIRQICKYNNITHTSHIKYDKSSYDIVYHIYC